jgi:hypothetical protein
MTKQVAGITINTKEELNSSLIKEEIGHIPNSEADLFSSVFITEESVKRGNEIADNLFSDTDKELTKD